MNPLQMLNKIKEQNRLRSKAFYDINKEAISLQRKQKRVEINNLILKDKENVAPQEQPPQQPPQPQPQQTVFETIPPATKNTPSNSLLTREEVRNAMKTTNYYTNEPTRKTNLAQLPLIYRSINNEPLLPWILYKTNDLVKAINNLKQINGNEYSITTFPRIFGSILAIIKFMNIEIPKSTDTILFNAYRTAKLAYDIFLYGKKHPTLDANTAVIRYDTLISNTLKKYKKNSLQYLLVKLYKDVPMRNDFSNMILTDNYKDLDKSKNYLVVFNGKSQVIINKYKTSKIHGTITKELSKDTSKLLLDYIKLNKIKVGDNLFNDLRQILNEITNDKTDKTDGGTRLIRRSLASSLYDDYIKKKATIEDIYNQVHLMTHSTSVHLSDYIYGVK